jgi:hypothetical protein
LLFIVEGTTHQTLNIRLTPKGDHPEYPPQSSGGNPVTSILQE